MTFINVNENQKGFYTHPDKTPWNAQSTNVIPWLHTWIVMNLRRHRPSIDLTWDRGWPGYQIISVSLLFLFRVLFSFSFSFFTLLRLFLFLSHWYFFLSLSLPWSKCQKQNKMYFRYTKEVSFSRLFHLLSWCSFTHSCWCT